MGVALGSSVGRCGLLEMQVWNIDGCSFREFCWWVWSLRDVSVAYRWVWPLGSSVGRCGRYEIHWYM